MLFPKSQISPDTNRAPVGTIAILPEGERTRNGIWKRNPTSLDSTSAMEPIKIGAFSHGDFGTHGACWWHSVLVAFRSSTLKRLPVDSADSHVRLQSFHGQESPEVLRKKKFS